MDTLLHDGKTRIIPTAKGLYIWSMLLPDTFVFPTFKAARCSVCPVAVWAKDAGGWDQPMVSAYTISERDNEEIYAVHGLTELIDLLDARDWNITITELRDVLSVYCLDM